MRRRISDSTAEDPSSIRSLPPLRSLYRVRSSGSQFRNPTSQERKDVTSNKRMKFTDPGVDNPLRCKLNASSTLLEGSQSPSSNDPKTSEFAFFKKVKENADRKFQSRILCKENIPTKKFKSSDCWREKTNNVKNSYEELRSSALSENVIPTSFSSFLFPPGGLSKNSDVSTREDCTTPGHSYNIWEKIEPYRDASNPGGAPRRHGDTFSRKRQKLCQWVLETSHPNIEELCSKGYDFVSVLLSRLFPRNDENSGSENLETEEFNIDTKSQFVDYLESDFQLQKLNQVPVRNYMELEYGPQSDDTPSSWLNRSEELVLPNSCFPGSDAIIACPKYEISEPGYELEGIVPVLCAESNSVSGCPSKRYGPLAYRRRKELGELDDSKEYLIQSEREPHNLLLGWDFERGTDGRHLSYDTPSCWLNRSEEMVLPNSCFPASDANIACPRSEISEPGYELEAILPVLCAESDPVSGSPSKRHGHLAYRHLKELCELDDSKEHLIQRELHNLLLGWDFERGTDGRHLSYDTPSCSLNRSEEMVLPNSCFPVSDACPRSEISEPGYGLEGILPVLCAESDSVSGSPSKRYGHLAYRRLKELCELDDSKEYLIQREPRNLLLGWDFDRGTDRRNLSVSGRSTELSLYSSSSSSWGDDCQHILDDRFGVNEVTKSSLPSTCSSKAIPLPWCQSANYSDDFGRQVEGKEDTYMDFNHCPLKVLLGPDYLNLAEDWENYTDCKDSGSIFPPNLHHIMSKVLSERYHHPGIDGFLLSSGHNIDLECNSPLLTGSSRKYHPPFNYALQTPQNEAISSRFLLHDKNESSLDVSSDTGTLNHFSEDMVNVQDWSSFFFRIPVYTDKAFPLLLDESSWDWKSKKNILC